MSFISKFTKRDFLFCLATGLGDGLVWWRIFAFLKIPSFHGIPWAVLILALPILWILGILLGYFLAQWFEFFGQFGRFSVIGFTNAAVDFGIFNLLIAYTGYTNGFGFAVIKSVPFVAALVCSYLLNKFWTFGGASGGRSEIGKFLLVTIGSFLVNVGISALVATFIPPLFGMSINQWANISSAVGVAIGLIFNFLGFKFAVFQK